LPARPLNTAKLLRKDLLSDPAQCDHFEFEALDLAEFNFIPGQFVSLVAPNSEGKQITRAYSIASAPRGNRFDLCVNRVQDGFFSNLLCDMQPGATVQFHGPHGLFTLRNPLLDCIFIATGTGIAPMRGFVEHLFGATPTHNNREIYLVYGTRHSTEFYYRNYFEQVARANPNFHYILSLSRKEEGWSGPTGYVQDRVREIVEARADKGVGTMHAYICGLNAMVSANREMLTGLGWDKKSIIFERYD
jgi:ferredoxin-NADP reductase